MIAVKLQGQLGNQLFQIAFIRRASKILKETYVILDDKSYGCLPDKYFRLKFTERKIPRKLLSRYFSFFQREISEHNNWQDTSSILGNLKAGVIYKGFFQSDRFFENISDKNIFRIRNQYWKIFRDKYEETFKKYRVILIHIRLKDYFEIGGTELGGRGLQLPFEYYQNAIDQINIDNSTRVMVISDDQKFVKENLRLKVPFSLETNHFIIDLLLLINANVLVLSNSTFSWWGAYLNIVDDLKVYAPEFWMGFKVNKPYPVDIMCKSWTLLSV
jgi:hypothetical protein